MRTHYLQHVPFEGLGSIKQWLQQNDHEVSASYLYKSPEFPVLSDFDRLIVMGGPMSVNDEDQYPWFVEEKRFIRKTIESGKPVLGVCLGAQLIASAMGSKVYPNPEKEIGWFPIHGLSLDDPYLFQFPSSLDVFHWHGETFDLPAGAKLLASSAACKNQAFQVGSSVIGLQFHLEMTLTSVEALVANCRDELVPSKYVQSEDEILISEPELYQTTQQIMGKILSFLIKKN